MHIAFVTPQMIIGGAETYIITKSRWLISHGHTVTVVSGGGENVVNLPEGAEHVEFTTEVSPASFTRRGYKEYLHELSEILTSRNIEVIEVHNTTPIIHIAASYDEHRIPFLVNVLNELTFKYNFVVRHIVKQIAPYKLFYTLTEGMWTYSSQKTGKKLDCNIIPIPVDAVPPNEDETGGDYVLSVCRMEADKMYIKHLIEAFGKLMLAGRLPDHYHLHVVGNGSLFHEVESVAQKVNRRVAREVVVMFGTLTGEKLWKQYRNAKLYVGTGTTLLLAASCGKAALIPGYTFGSMPYAWGVWGERPTDTEVLASTERQGLKRENYAEIIYELLIGDPQRTIRAGSNAKKIFDSYYATEPIMSRWEKEYAATMEIFSHDGEQIARQVRVSSLLRYIYKMLYTLRNTIKRGGLANKSYHD